MSQAVSVVLRSTVDGGSTEPINLALPPQGPDRRRERSAMTSLQRPSAGTIALWVMTVLLVGIALVAFSVY